jgi:hypothetical protein
VMKLLGYERAANFDGSMNAYVPSRGPIER